ncbi:MAG: TIGR03905 family TSCPD domain-containing protein [Sphaerochaetaceae bacterium]|jgi:uncharacterized protein (TIGR03905 family)|nr:TIGR03905 family TSCPD domain-containing protein [Sphaerochaetaceae bacterium]
MSDRTIVYTPRGVCASRIKVVLEQDDTIKSVEFTNGCDGNHSGIAALCVGLKAEDAASRLEGITCGPRSTSCPDQLAKALRQR